MPQHQGTFPVWLTALHEAFKQNRQFDIHWITASKHVQKIKTIAQDNQHFHIIPRARKTIGLYTGYIWDRIQIARALRTINPQLVHAWGTEDVYALAGKDFKGKKLLSIQGLLNAYNERGPITPFEKKQCLWERIALRAYQHITTESPWARERTQETVNKADFLQIEYGVEESFFQIERSLSEQPTCLYGGMLNKLKGTDILIEAFMTPELSHIQLRLAGNGPIMEQYRSHITGNIHFLGALNRQSMAHELSQAWCLIHPSHADTGPTIAKEARVVGLPVILTENCGSKQHIRSGESGYIIPPGNKQAIIDAVLKTVTTAKHSRTMGASHQAKDRTILRPELTATRFMELYGKLTATA